MLIAPLAAVVIGLPTVMIPNSWFSRMTPTRWWEYPIWLASSALIAMIVATFVRVGPRERGTSREIERTASGGVLSALAVGCPVCNKVVVALIGVSGALHFWAPLQPLLGAASLALLATALARRLDGQMRCALPQRQEA